MTVSVITDNKSDVEQKVEEGYTSQDGAIPKAQVADIDLQKEQALLRKIDLHIVPFLIVLYLFSFLDRGRCCPAAFSVVAH